MNTQFKSFLVGQGVGYTDAEGYMGDSTLSVRLDFLKKKKKEKEKSEANKASGSAELGGLRTIFFLFCHQFMFEILSLKKPILVNSHHPRGGMQRPECGSA